ncbi:MAG: hypothetical protein ACYC0K_06520, partial [Thermoleophilia bacterium]
GTFLYLVITQASLFFIDDQTIKTLTRENNFYESSGALFLFFTSVLLFILFLKTRRGLDLHFFRTNRNYLVLFMALLFFIGSGEEISWGQQIFHWDTPEFIKDINVQGETNIHNLRILRDDADGGGGKSVWRMTLNFNHLFTLMGVAYCFLIPLGAMASSKIARWLKRAGIPLAPLWLGVFFLLSYLFLKYAQANTPDPVAKLSYVEMAESNFSFVFFVIALWWVTNLQGNDTGRPPV